MKVLHLNYARNDGAGIAARRLHEALLGHGIASEFIYLHPFTRDARISCLERKFISVISRAQRLLVPRGFSLAWIPSRLVRIINASDADVIHLHWVQAGMLSIAQIAKIKKPVVWTFHDMWPMCAAQHYVDGSEHIDGPAVSGGKKWHDWLKRWGFRRKKKFFHQMNVTIIAPSRWMQQCAQESLLFSGKRTVLVQNCVDTSIFKPLIQDRGRLRDKYNIPIDKRVILFGAMSVFDARKGYDLLALSIQRLAQSRDDLVVVVFGCDAGEPFEGVRTIWLGKIHGDVAMAEVCNCADVICVPSRMDNLPSTAVEPQACGVPVVAFDVGGLMDIVEHKKTGYLAQPFSVDDYVAGINWALEKNPAEIAQYTSTRAVALFCMESTASKMAQVYRDAIVEIGKL